MNEIQVNKHLQEVDLLKALLDTLIKLHDYEITYNFDDIEWEEDNYEVFDIMYGTLGYDYYLERALQTNLNIYCTSDLMEFYKLCETNF